MVHFQDAAKHADLLSPQIHEHILLHGDYRKKVSIDVAGEKMEVEEMVDSEEEGEGIVQHDTLKYAKRGSFLLMKDQLQRRGYEVK